MKSNILYNSFDIWTSTLNSGEVMNSVSDMLTNINNLRGEASPAHMYVHSCI